MSDQVDAADLQVGVRYRTEDRGVWEVVDEDILDAGKPSVRSLRIKAIDAPHAQTGDIESDAAEYQAEAAVEIVAKAADAETLAETLRDCGVPVRESEVVATRATTDQTYAEIADELGLHDKAEVSKYISRYRDRRENAVQLAEHGPEV